MNDRYSLKDVNECIGDIDRTGSSIILTQMPIEKQSQQLTAFRVPRLGQYE
jgi:hypothetical protein